MSEPAVHVCEQPAAPHLRSQASGGVLFAETRNSSSLYVRIERSSFAANFLSASQVRRKGEAARGGMDCLSLLNKGSLRHSIAAVGHNHKHDHPTTTTTKAPLSPFVHTLKIFSSLVRLRFPAVC